MFALELVDLLGRLRRTGWTHRFRGFWRAPGNAQPGGSSPEWAVFLAVGVELSSGKMDTSSYEDRGGFATIGRAGIGSCEPSEVTGLPR
jgi:hypothetical protein